MENQQLGNYETNSTKVAGQARFCRQQACVSAPSVNSRWEERRSAAEQACSRLTMFKSPVLSMISSSHFICTPRRFLLNDAGNKENSRSATLGGTTMVSKLCCYLPNSCSRQPSFTRRVTTNMATCSSSLSHFHRVPSRFPHHIYHRRFADVIRHAHRKFLTVTAAISRKREHAVARCHY